MGSAVSPKHSNDYKGLSTTQRIARAGKALFSAYRSDLYADPDGFAIQVAAVFELYEIEVVEALVDPRNSYALQSVHKWPPSIAEIRTALDEESSRRARLRAAASEPKLVARPAAPRRSGPGCRANVKVNPDAPQFSMVEGLVASGTLEPEDWARELDGSVRIALNLWNDLYKRVTASESWKPMSDAALRAHYGQREAEAARSPVVESENPAP